MENKTHKQVIISGMEGAACSAAVERALKRIDGVENASVNLASETATFDFDKSKVDDQKILDTIIKAGFNIVEKSEEQKEIKEKTHSVMKILLIISIVLSSILMVIAMGPMFSLKISKMPYLQMVLAFSVMLCGYHFFTKGFKALFHLQPNMDSLVAIATSASFIYSTVSIFTSSPLYFDGVAMIITLVKLGKYLEYGSKEKSKSAIKALMDLTPDTALVIRNGLESVINIKRVIVGDTIIIKPGDKLPVDGIIIDGKTSIDESMLSGESVAVFKEIGDSVYAATINTTGAFTYKATQVGDDTALANIIKLVKQAQGSKAPISRIADQVSGIFVPIVLLISIVTFLVWYFLIKDVGYALEKSVSVLVIACPCSLGLATPIAIMVASGKGAKLGILFRDAKQLEILQKVEHIMFDKTGTLTKGELQLASIVCFDNYDEDKAIQIAASIENNSEHPISRAIVNKAKEKNITIDKCDDFNVILGQGVFARINNNIYNIGNEKLIKNIDEKVNAVNIKLQKDGFTTLLLEENNKIIAIFGVQDTIREESYNLIEFLNKNNIKSTLLTGDNKNTANAICKQLGIKEYKASLMPDEKEKIIREAKKNNTMVAMIGDGINDAPALSSADVGIAVAKASDVAKESASVVLVNGSLDDVITAIRLSRATIRNIKQNLFWAFFYNTASIPIAAGVFVSFGLQLTPALAALCMSFSSLFVVLNALRLNNFK
jgi:Cu+-exporting ATPase